MSDLDKKHRIDDDILRCKADILRSSDAGDPSRKKTKSANKPAEEKPQTQPIPIVTIEDQKAETKEKNTTKSQIKPKKTLHDIIPQGDNKSAQKRKNFQIPKFDLGEEILAEHRKLIGTKRKKSAPKTAEPLHPTPPDVKTQPLKEKIEPTAQKISHQTPKPSQRDKLISKIVARDIAHFCQRQ